MDDLRDPQLDRALRERAALTVVDTTAAHERVIGRAATIRRRRAVIAGAGALVLVAGAATLWLRGADNSAVTVPATDVTVTRLPSTVPPATTADADATPDPTALPATDSPATTVGESAETTTPATQPPTSAAPGTTVEPPPAPATTTETFSSPGGSITVRSNGSTLTLLSVNPSAGYEQEIEDERPDRVRVRFRTADDSWRIEVRLENGQMTDIVSN